VRGGLPNRVEFDTLRSSAVDPFDQTVAWLDPATSLNTKSLLSGRTGIGLVLRAVKPCFLGEIPS
jgi:hypothetical protein